MPKIKKKFKNKFTTVSNDFLSDRELKLKERGMLITMLSLPDDWNYSHMGLAAILPESPKTVNNILRELERKGYLVRRRIRDDKRFTDIEYIFSDSKLNIDELELDGRNEHVAFEHEENEHVPFEHVQSDRQLNTNKENNKELNINKESLESDFMYIKTLHDMINGFYEVEGMILNCKQTSDLNQLVKEVCSGEISSSKADLIKYVRRLYDEGFKDSKGQPIKSLYGYVRMNFLLKTRDDKIGEDLLKRDGFGYY